jgi:AcrR family transcriptional regulator
MSQKARKKRQVLPPEERQEMILDAALEMFSRYGYESCDVDKIAAHAGIGKGTIYRHFPSKENLFVSVIDRGYAHLDEQMREMEQFINCLDEPGESLEEILTKELTLYVDFFIDNPECYRILMIERPEIRLTLDEETFAGHLTHIAKMVDRIQAGIKSGFLANLNPSFIAYCYLSLAGVIVERKLYGKRNTVRKDIRNAVELLLNGVLLRKKK